MDRHLTTTSTRSRPGSLYSASNEYRHDALTGRCDQGKLVDDIRDLLSVNFVPKETEEQRARIIALFVLDLAEFSDDCVWWAMREWRQNNDRRPTPAALRQLAMMRRQEAVKASAPRYVPDRSQIGAGGFPSPLSDAEMERRQATIAKAAQSCGWKFDGRRIYEDQPPRERVPHWTETAKPDDPRFAALKEARAKANALYEATR